MISRIGKYEIQAELGVGGFGRVFRGYDPSVGRQVAIKILTVDSDADMLARFRAEAGTAGGLRHKNIVVVHEYGEHEGLPYIVMELVEGQDLHQIIESRVPLDLVDKLGIMFQIAEGLQCAHQAGIVHRDIKPANIMLLPDGTVKIMDFGIALVTGQNTTRRTHKGDLLGTILYFAPEQFRECEADCLTDIFAYGVIYYELLTGVHPFQAKDPGAIMYRITSTDTLPLAELVPGCPEALELVIQRALSKDRELRYQSIDDVLFDSQPILLALRQQRGAKIVLDVPALIESGDLRAAQSKVREVLELDPANSDARKFREALQQQTQRDAVRTRVESLAKEAEAQIVVRHFSEAVEILESAIRLDRSNALLQKRLETARMGMEAARRSARLLSDARAQAQQGQLTGAFTLVIEAIQADTDNREAELLKETLERQIAERDRQRRVDEALRAAERHRVLGEFAQALSVLDRCEREQPGAAEVGPMRARIASEQAEQEFRRRAELFRAHATEVRQALRAENLTEASRLADQLAADFPDEPGLHDVRAEVKEHLAARRRADEIAAISRKVRRLLKEKRFEEAVECVRAGLSTYPGDPALERSMETTATLETAERRARQIAEALSACEEARAGGKLDTALAVALQALSSFPEEPALMGLKQKVELELETQRYAEGLRRLIEDARRLLREAHPAKAVKLLQESATHANEPDVLSLLAEARNAEAAQNEKDYVGEALHCIGALEEGGQSRAALEQAENAFKRYPANQELLEVSQRLRDRVSAEDRTARLKAHEQLVCAALSAAAWPRAVAALAAAEKEFPNETRWKELADKMISERREAELKALRAAVEQNIGHGDIEVAARQLQAARDTFSTDPAWQEMANEIELRRTYRDGIREGEAALERGDYEAALKVLEPLASPKAPDSRAADLLRSTRTLSRITGEGLAKCNKLRSRGKLAEALRVLNSALKEAGHEPALTALKEKLEIEFEAARYSEGLRTLLDEARKSLTEQRAGAAVALLERADRRYANEPELAALLADARQAKTAHDEREYVRTVLERIASLESGRKLNAALEQAEQALKRYPENQDVEGAAERLRELVKVDERRSRIQVQEQRIEQPLAAGAWSRAEAAIAEGRQQFPDHPRWDVFSEQLRKSRREAELKLAKVRIEQSLAAGDLAEAGRFLEQSREAFSTEKAWQDLAAALERRRAYERELLRAEQASERRDYVEAERILQSLVTGAPDRRAAKRLKATRSARSQEAQATPPTFATRQTAEPSREAQSKSLSGAVEMLLNWKARSIALASSLRQKAVATRIVLGKPHYRRYVYVGTGLLAILMLFGIWAFVRPRHPQVVRRPAPTAQPSAGQTVPTAQPAPATPQPIAAPAVPANTALEEKAVPVEAQTAPEPAPPRQVERRRVRTSSSSRVAAGRPEPEPAPVELIDKPAAPVRIRPRK